MEKKEVLVVFGGASPEHEVSCSSAAALIGAISREKYNVHCLGITREGNWILTEASTQEIGDAKSWLTHGSNRKAVLSPDRADHGLLVFEDNGIVKQPIDVVFPIIHGETGEDGQLQGLLEIAGIPYVGCGVCASACSMDKSVTMNFARLCHVQFPEYYSCPCNTFLADPEKIAADVVSHFRKTLGEVFPLFVKPASTGSSVGISKVHNEEELMDALRVAAQYPGSLIVEQNIVGKEIKVAVLGHDNGLRVGELCEVMVDNGIFNTFELKYKSSGSHKKIPADLPEAVANEVKESAVNIYRSLGCRGFARVDFFVTADNTVVFNEINTVPGFTRGSIYSLMFEKAGVSYETLVEELISMSAE